MKDLKALDAPSGFGSVGAGQLLRALSVLETHAESLVEKLVSFDKPDATLPDKDLSQLQEGLKRIATRVGESSALAERIGAVRETGTLRENDPESLIGEGSGPTKIVMLEDELFPIEGPSDDTTGLPSRGIAKKAIKSAIAEGRPRFAAVFVLDRFSHMSNRYGDEFGNQAIRHYAQFLSQKAPPDSLLFRWHGPAFLTLFDSSGTVAEAKLVIEQVAMQKQKFNFITSNRSVMVNLTASFVTIPLVEHTEPDSVFKQASRFIDEHAERQPH